MKLLPYIHSPYLREYIHVYRQKENLGVIRWPAAVGNNSGNHPKWQDHTLLSVTVLYDKNISQEIGKSSFYGLKH